jgi:hypothetical protein
VRILVDNVCLLSNFKYYFRWLLILSQIARVFPFNLQLARFYEAYEATLAPFIKDRRLDLEVK